MRVSTAIALTISVFAVSTNAAPVPDLLGPVSGILGKALPGSAVTTTPQAEAVTPEPTFEKRDDFLGGLLGKVLPGSAVTTGPQAEALTPEPTFEKRDDFLGGLLGKVLPGSAVTTGPQAEAMTPEPTFEKRDDFLGGLLGKVLPGSAVTTGPQAEAVTPEPTFEKRDDFLGGLLGKVLPGSAVTTGPQAEAVTPEPTFEKRDDFLGGLLGKVLPGSAVTTGPQAEAAPVTSATTESLETPEPMFEKRGIPTHVSAIVDLIVKTNSEIVVKALATLKANICADVRSKLHIVATGLLSTDTDVVIPTISAKIEDETRLAVNTKIDLDVQLLVVTRIRAHALKVIAEICPHGDDDCLVENAEKIVADVEALVQIDITKLFIALKANLMAHVRAKVGVVIRKLGLNLLVEQIHIEGFLDAVADVNVHLDLCSHIIGRNIEILAHAKAKALIRSICRA